MGQWLELFDEEFLDDLKYGFNMFLRVELLPLTIFTVIALSVYYSI